MTTIAIDGQSEEEFRRSIESDLRHGRDSVAIGRLQKLLEPYAGPDGILPTRFLTVTAADLALRGWSYLGDCIARHDRPGRPVTAISIAFGWAGEEPPAPDEQGRLNPHVETGYYNDAAYPFSQSGRDDLLDGYSLHGCTWAADCEASDNALSVDGIDDLHGALALLEAQLLTSDEPDADAIVAGSLGACLLSALLFQAVGQRIAADGLPRPVCVTAGSNGVYPYFDSPVAGMPESARRAAEKAEEEEADTGVPGPRYSSLLMTGIPRAQKRAVLVLAETEGEMAVRIARLRGHGEGGDGESQPPAAPPLPEPIPALPASPLLSKKSPQHNWDFRDMLGPPPGTLDAAPQPESGPEPEPEPEWADEPTDLAAAEPTPTDAPEAVPDAAPEWSEASWDDPVDQPEPVCPSPEPSEAPAEPGFALLGGSLQGRLESLLSPQVPLSLAPPPELYPDDQDVAEQPAAAEPWPEHAAGLAWPFGTGWDALGAQEPEAPETPAEIAEVVPEPAGLFARLRTWLRRGR